MSDDGRLPPAWGPPPPPHEPVSAGGLAGLFAEPSGPPPPAPPDPALLAAQYQAQQEDAAAAPTRTAGAHRARRQPARYIVPAIIGALAIVAVVVGISGWFRTGDKTATTPPPSQVAVTTPSKTLSGSPSATPTESSVAPTPTPTPTPTPSPPARTTAAAPPPPAVVHAPTVVLNETQIRGLAAQVAARLRTKGWTVTGTGNWHGQIGSTTVYYPKSLAAAARRLAYDLGITRIRPVVGGMLTDRLTVVLTGNPYA